MPAPPRDVYDLRDLDWSDPGVREHIAFYATYGFAMHVCQSLEMAMVRLAHLQSGLATGPNQPASETPHERDLKHDEELKLLEALFRSTAGQLKQRLNLPTKLAGDLKEAVDWRNYLAHSFLIDRALDTRDLKSRQIATDAMLEIANGIHHVTLRLDEHAETEMRNLGVPEGYMDDPEVRRKWHRVLEAAGVRPLREDPGPHSN